MSNKAGSKVGPIDLLGIAGLRRKKDGREKYGAFNRRMFAATIDLFIFMLTFGLVIKFAFNHVYGPVKLNLAELKMTANRQSVAMLFWEALYHTGDVACWFCMLVLSGLCWHKWSATPGKMLMRLKIVDATTEQPISWGQIVLRLAGYVISFACLCAGFFWIGANKRRQGWHDKLAHTVVLALPWRKAKSGSAAAGRSGSPAPSAKV